MMIIIYIIYYLFSISPIVLSYRFRKYTVVDYRYNKLLNKKRLVVLIFNIGCLLGQGVIVGLRKSILISHSGYEILISSAFIFIFIYIFFSLGRLETPKHPFKKK